MCCGTIFIGPHGEVAIDARYFKPCNEGCNKKDKDNHMDEAGMEVDTSDTASIEEDDDSNLTAARKLAEDCAASPAGDFDEGFFDKPGPSPSSGCSNTPPPPEVVDESDESNSAADLSTTRSPTLTAGT